MQLACDAVLPRRYGRSLAVSANGGTKGFPGRKQPALVRIRVNPITSSTLIPRRTDQQSERSDAGVTLWGEVMDLVQQSARRSHGFCFQVELVGVVNKSVEDGICESRITSSRLAVVFRCNAALSSRNELSAHQALRKSPVAIPDCRQTCWPVHGVPVLRIGVRTLGHVRSRRNPDE